MEAKNIRLGDRINVMVSKTESVEAIVMRVDAKKVSDGHISQIEFTLKATSDGAPKETLDGWGTYIAGPCPCKEKTAVERWAELTEHLRSYDPRSKSGDFWTVGRLLSLSVALDELEARISKLEARNLLG